MNWKEKYECIIGLEIHAQLKTQSKMFSSDTTEFLARPNSQVTPTSLGLPGALPTVNKKAVEMAIQLGLALNAKIRLQSQFARKHYFYPDLPKGYQISQYDLPICYDGFVDIDLVNGQTKRVRILRAHLEEDAGKSIHQGSVTWLDFNRAGIPLIEIVSGPDLRSPEEAAIYAKAIRQILRYLDICDGNLEEGSMRCDCNISVRLKGSDQLGTKVEVKNINSFRFIEKALGFEFERQALLLENGQKIEPETRLYDPDKNRTFTMRTKETAQDYRYFPDPDLPILEIDSGFVESLKSGLPELPRQKLIRYQNELGLPLYDAQILTSEKEIAEYFEAVLQHGVNAKLASNWIMTELLGRLNDAKLSIDQSPVRPHQLADLIKGIENGEISGKIGKMVFNHMWQNPGARLQEVLKHLGIELVQDDSQIEAWVDQVMAENPENVKQYRSGKTKLFGYFVGQIMKLSKGQANPQKVNEILKRKLES